MTKELNMVRAGDLIRIHYNAIDKGIWLIFAAYFSKLLELLLEGVIERT